MSFPVYTNRNPRNMFGIGVKNVRQQGKGYKVERLLLLSLFSRARLCAPLWTAAHQSPPSMGFPRQEYWSELLFPSPKVELGQIY